MTTAATPIRGTVSGRTIILEEPTGLPDGQAVSVRLAPVAGGQTGTANEALRRAFGAWADDPDGVDKFVADVRRDRDDRRPGAE